MTVDASQDFLENQQYTVKNILKYELIFGNGFISTGGVDSTTKLITEPGYLISTQLKSTAKVLDVGCGIGGGDALIASTFPEAQVHGLDLSSNCVNIAKSRYANHPRLSFEVADVLSCDLPRDEFDLVYSRDVILHIASKQKLFQRLLDSARKGGLLFITDYCRGLGEPSDEFNSYVDSRGYSLLTIEEYAEVIQKAGWVIERFEDNTTWFSDILSEEQKRTEKMRTTLDGSFTPEDIDDLISGWVAKLDRIDKKQMAWGLFIARKP